MYRPNIELCFLSKGWVNLNPDNENLDQLSLNQQSGKYLKWTKVSLKRDMDLFDLARSLCMTQVWIETDKGGNLGPHSCTALGRAYRHVVSTGNA